MKRTLKMKRHCLDCVLMFCSHFNIIEQLNELFIIWHVFILYTLNTKKFYNKSQIPQDWAVDLGEKIRSQFNKSTIIKKYEEVLLEIAGHW